MLKKIYFNHLISYENKTVKCPVCGGNFSKDTIAHGEVVNWQTMKTKICDGLKKGLILSKGK